MVEKAAPTFLQVTAESSHHGVAMVKPLSLLQEEESSAESSGDSLGLEQMVENYGTQVQEGPFDSVTKNRRDRIAKKNSIDTLTSTIRWSKMAIVRLDDDLKYLESEIKRLADVKAGEEAEL